MTCNVPHHINCDGNKYNKRGAQCNHGIHPEWWFFCKEKWSKINGLQSFNTKHNHYSGITNIVTIVLLPHYP